MKLGIHQKITTSWVVLAVTSIGCFFLARKHVESRRYDAMIVRQKVRREFDEEVRLLTENKTKA
jgi:hypothetical protein